MFINQSDDFYDGDLQPGDRAATAQEIADHLAEKADQARLGKTVSRCQARVALLEAGLLDTVEAAMSAPGANPIAVIAWRTAQEFKRSSPTMLGMAADLGLTDEQLDDLFAAAAVIEV